MKFILSLFLLFSLVACKVEKTESTNGVSLLSDPELESSSYYSKHYSSDTLEGNYVGKDWSVKKAFVEKSFAGYRFAFYDQDSGDACTMEYSANDLNISIDGPLKKGQILLGEKGLTATFYESSTNINYIAFNGAFEIISIDLDKKIVLGRLNIHQSEETFANGTFEATLCE